MSSNTSGWRHFQQGKGEKDQVGPQGPHDEDGELKLYYNAGDFFYRG